MTGDQYGLWEIDQAPLPEELVAQAPRLHPVECGLCQTLMYATDSQLGTKLKCPDCGTLTVAQPRAPVKPRDSVIVPDGEEYQLDAASAPTPRPAPVPIAVRVAELHEEQRRSGVAPATRSDAAAAAETGGELEGPRRRRLGEAPPAPPPDLPAVPLVQGVLPMLLTGEILLRWVVLSLTLTLAGWFLSWILQAMGSQVFMAIPMFAIGCVFAGLWMLSALPLGLVIVTESSEGNDRLEDPPNWLSFDFAEAFFVAVSAAVAAIPAWLTTKATTTLPVEAQAAIAAGTWLVCFPISLLSGLEQSSAFAVFSPRLATSLLRCAGAWLLFYIESALVAAAVGFVAWKVFSEKPELWPVLPWFGVAAGLLYMRLVGRLAWWIAETMPAPAEAEEN